MSPTPNQTDNERAILGCAMLDLGVLDRTRIRPEHLTRDAHSALLRHMLDLRKAGRLETLEELHYSLASSRDLEEQVGGLGYVTAHPDRAATSEAAPYLERLLLEAYHRREVKAAALRATGRIDSGEPARTVDGTLRAELDSVAGVGEELCEPAAEVAERVWERQDTRLRTGASRYVPTGWRQWDASEDGMGWSSEGVTYILARSGMGKTSFLNSTAVQMAMAGFRVVIHGTETSRQARIDAMACGVAGIDVRRYDWLARQRAEGRATAQQDDELEQTAILHRDALRWLGALPLRVSGAGLTVEVMAAEVSRLRHAALCDVLVVDYLQDFVVSTGVKVGEKMAQVNHASSVLKTLAARLSLPVICGAQVSGEKEGTPRGDLFPEMWDVQWSSGAHQDAEEIYALNRGEYWRDRLGRAYKPAEHGACGIIEVQARKRRAGRLIRVELPWDGPTKWVGYRPAWRIERAWHEPEEAHLDA